MVKFGTFAPQGWRLELRGVEGGAAQWARLRSVAQTLERTGWDSLWLYDHFHTVPRTEIEPTFECWTTMAALAEATKKIRLTPVRRASSNVQWRFLTTSGRKR